MYSAHVRCVTPIFKCEEKTDKKNYRHVSILNSLSKVFENVMKEQLIPFFENCLSAFNSAYGKEYSSKNVLLRLIESWRRCLDQSISRRNFYGFVESFRLYPT